MSKTILSSTNLNIENEGWQGGHQQPCPETEKKRGIFSQTARKPFAYEHGQDEQQGQDEGFDIQSIQQPLSVTVSVYFISHREPIQASLNLRRPK